MRCSCCPGRGYDPVDGVAAAKAVRGGSIVGSIATLSATAMGAGILSLPIAISYCGAVLGTLLLLVFAVLSDVSLIMLLRASKATGLYDLEVRYVCVCAATRRS